MHDSRTVPHAVHQLPVKSLRVEVVEGPDKGKSSAALGDVLAVGTARSNDLVLSDETVSRFHLELRRQDGQIALNDLGSTNGTRVGEVLVQRGLLSAGATLIVGKSVVRVHDGRTVDCQLHSEDHLGAVRGRAPNMRRLLASAARVAHTDASILLMGETGTGKEVLARAIHDASPRRDAPFEAVDCGALLPSLVASELFGHERGAFTGAEARHAGAFERAEGGTLFLDEIGELPMPLQANLLGVLERKQFRRLGGAEPVRANVRVMAATHRDLRAEVNAGRFREDLYYRLAVVLLRLPSLRERPGDVPVLIQHFLQDAGHTQSADELFSAEVMQGLERHAWPGNVRELRNFVDAALAMGELPDLMPGRSLQAHVIQMDAGALVQRPYRAARDEVLAHFQKAYLTQLLDLTQGNVSAAARRSGMDRTYLAELARRLGLKS